MRLRVCLLILLVMPAAARAAESLALAERLFEDGRWQAAVVCGRALETAQGFALAARARMAAASHDEDRAARRAALDAALADAERALALADTLAEGHLQAAAAFGFRAQMTRAIADVRRSKRHIERAAALAPDDPFVLAGLGYWHGRTALGAGDFFAGLLFGADRDDGVAAFERALELDPVSPTIRAGFGRLLLRFRKPALTERGLAELARSMALPAQTALERSLLADARKLLEAADAGADVDALGRLADRLAPFNG